MPVPRISVVVPIYNVEAYLETCLDSLAGQTFGDFEALLVDDGSTDDSARIAEAYASRDERFRLIRQTNGGLSKARNTGIDAATGEFLAFLDSDDMLPRDAYERLLAALDATGSDFASGNVKRISQWSVTQSRFVAKTFGTTRLKTHVTSFRPLLADRTAWNKLFRRSFWDRHAFRFPEGVVHEDIPVTVPAHFLAKSVDVLADTVYLYRLREDGNLSITQRRLEQRVLLDRLAAVESVSAYLGQHGPRNAKRWYDESAVADDLRLHLNILDSADDAYRELFLDRVNAYLDTTDDAIYDPLLAIDRLKWHLVRRRLMPELLEVLRFQKEEMATTPPVQVGGRWYGDYPFRTDATLDIPRKVYALDKELPLTPHLEAMRFEDGRLRLRGHAYVTGVGAPERDSQSLQLTALRPGRLRRVRLLVSGLRLKTSQVHRPELTAASPQPFSDLAWSGFEATLDPRRLRRRGRWAEGTWELFAIARAGRLTRRRARFAIAPGHPVPAVELPAPDGVMVRAAASLSGRVTFEVRTSWARLTGRHLRDDGTLELSGELRLPAAEKPRLELRRRSDDRLLKRPLTVDAAAGTFSAAVPLAKLRSDADQRAEDLELDSDDRVIWELWAVAGGVRVPVSVSAEGAGQAWPSGDREVSLFRTRQGEAALVERDPRPVLEGAEWTADGALELSGRLPEGPPAEAIVLLSPDSGERHAFPLATDGRAFSARLEPAAVESLAGPRPLPEAVWHVRAARTGAEPVPVQVALALRDRLPLRTVVDRKPFTLGVRPDHAATLLVELDLPDDERGGYHQRLLREVEYPARRRQPLRDSVLFVGYGGRQYSESPRAIHEELVRRDSALEQLWVVRDGMCRVPATATAVREGSREHADALARSRYVVGNDDFPAWFERRPDQVVVQTWHGTPLKRLGLDISDTRRVARRFELALARQVGNWQYVLSPNRFSTPILRRAYAIEGELLELGSPRVDLLLGPDREERARALRARLGIPDGVRTVLYAPTYRDQVTDRRGRYRLEQRLDVDALRAAVGDDTVVLYRPHHYVFDAAPATADGFVRDLSSFPDGTELMLAADVLVTDYSSMPVDFAATGRPMLFYAYDLELYRDEIRGFSLDFEATMPGPLLRTTGELGEALRDLDGVTAEHARRYADFRAAFCELDDGNAAARVVDRLFEG